MEFSWETEIRNRISYFTELYITKLYKSIWFKINRNFEFKEKALKISYSFVAVRLFV